jgi:hypoxia up-regulated 1
LKTHVSRTQLETLAASLIQRATHAPIQAALAVANRTLQDLTAMELIGGGMRIPKIQQEITSILPSHLDALGLHMNSDESFALGAAFAGANISTAFRVRQVGMTDINPFPIGVSLSNLPTKSTTTTTDSVDAAWSKTATLFKAFGKVGVKKTIAFTHDQNIHCGLDYISNDLLPVGTELGLVRYNITGIPEFLQELLDRNVTGGSSNNNNTSTSSSASVGSIKPKISLQFELSTSGLVALVKAEAAVEETYTVQEEVDDDVVEEEVHAGNNSTGTNSSSTSSSNMDTNNTTTTVADDDATTNTTTNDSTGSNETITVNNMNATDGVPPLQNPKNSTVPPKKKRLVEKVSGLL